MKVNRDAMRRMTSALGNLLFPPVCALCRAATARPHALCADCWRGLRFIERPFCEVFGTPFGFDPGPGAVSPEAIASPPPFGRLRAALAYDENAGRLVSALKYADRLELAPLMAGWMHRAGSELLAQADVIVPMPLHRWRLLRRRFNQSAELARRIAAAADVPYAPTALLRVKPTRRQVGLGRAERHENVRGAFQVPERHRVRVAGRRILLVDDVYTTGATAEAAARALRRGGAAAVDVLVFARVAGPS